MSEWYPIISCDSHIHEPAALYQERLPRRLVERGPRVVSEPKGDKVFLGDRLVRFVGLEAMEEFDVEDRDYKGARYEVGRRGKFEFEARSHDLAIDDIQGEIVYGFSYWMDQEDREVLHEMIKVYNDWVHEFIAPTNDRSIAPAMLPSWDPELAITEAHRVVTELNARALQIAAPYVGEVEFGYRNAAYDRLWAAIVELDLPVTIHIGSGKAKGRFGGPGAIMCDFMATFNDSRDLVVELISAGVFERFPALRFAVTEGGIGWAPWLVMMMDRMHADNGHMLDHVLPEPPSYYFGRNCLVTWQEDVPGVRNLDYIEDSVAWGSDYPHREGTFPHSRDKIRAQVGNLPIELQRKICGENAAKFFQLDLDLLARRYGPRSEFAAKYGRTDGGVVTPEMAAPISS